MHVISQDKPLMERYPQLLGEGGDTSRVLLCVRTFLIHGVLDLCRPQQSVVKVVISFTNCLSEGGMFQSMLLCVQTGKVLRDNISASDCQ